MTTQHDDRNNGSARRRQTQALPEHLMQDDPVPPRGPLDDVLGDLDAVFPFMGMTTRWPTRPAASSERPSDRDPRSLDAVPTPSSPLAPLGEAVPVHPPDTQQTAGAALRPPLRHIRGSARPAVPSERPAVATQGVRQAPNRTPARQDPVWRTEEEYAVDQAAENYRRSERDLVQVHRLRTEPFEHPSQLFVLPHVPSPVQQRMPLLVLLGALVSIVILVTLGSGGSLPILSGWRTAAPKSDSATIFANLFAQPHPAGDYNLQGAPSLTAEQIDHILAAYGSPATGTGSLWVALGRRYGIDPVFAVAFFIHESGAGTSPGWAGLKSDGSTTHNIGNIICAGYATCDGRFRDYGSWEEGIGDWYKLIAVEYIQGRGTTTVDEIIPIYAPSFENDVQNYINTIKQLVDGWRTNGVA